MAKAKKKIIVKKVAKKIVAKKANVKKTITKKTLPKKSVRKSLTKKSALKKRVKLVKKLTTKKAAPKKIALKKAAAKKTAPHKTVTKKLNLKPGQTQAPAKLVLKKGGGLPEQLLNAALTVLDQRQAEEVFTVELAGKSSMADYLIIASGRASRQLGAMAHYLREAFENLGVERVRVEGITEGNWVLIDAGDIIVHLFRPEVRKYYNLESIWQK